RDHSYRRHIGAQPSVDERRFPGVELTDDRDPAWTFEVDADGLQLPAQRQITRARGEPTEPAQERGPARAEQPADRLFQQLFGPAPRAGTTRQQALDALLWRQRSRPQ